MPKQCFITDHLPRQSVHFQAALSQFLSMSDANFGAIDLDTFAFVLRLKLDSLPATGNYNIMSQYDNGSSARQAYELRVNGNGRVRVQNWTGGQCYPVSDLDTMLFKMSLREREEFLSEFNDEDRGFLESRYQSMAEGNDVDPSDAIICSVPRTNWIVSTTALTIAECHEIMAHCDPNNALTDRRLKLWIDGTQETPSSSTIQFKGRVNNSTEDIRIGSRDGNQFFDGKIYELAFFSGNLPATSDIRHPDGTPKDLRDLPGLKAHLTVDCGDVTKDEMLATNWINNNGVLASDEICDGLLT